MVGDAPLIVHYWTDLQSVHGLRCEREMSASALYSLYAWFSYSWPS